MVIHFANKNMEKTTTERIQQILKDIFIEKYDQDIIKNQLEALVIQAQLEYIKNKK